jgi:hypothetical protein
MQRTLLRWFLAGALVCVPVLSADLPAGNWEGRARGRKAVSLEISSTPSLHGSIVFYILHDEGDGSRNGSALPAQPLDDLEWDGAVLRFSVSVDDRSVNFEMRLAGVARAVLKRLAAGDEPELVIELTKE